MVGKKQVLIMNQESMKKLAELIYSTPLGNQTLASATAVTAHFQLVFELLGEHTQDEKEESL